MKLIQFIVFFQLMLIGIVIGLDENNNNNSTQVNNSQNSGREKTDKNQKNEDNSNNNSSSNKEKEPESKKNEEDKNLDTNKDGNQSDKNKDDSQQKDDKNQENKQDDNTKDEENKDKKKNNSIENSKTSSKDKLGVSIQLLKPVRLEAVQGILFSIGETVEFEWKWAKDIKPKRSPEGFNLLAVRYVSGNIARYPIATNLSSSIFKFTLDSTLKNVTELFDTMAEANDYLFYIYDSANGADYLGADGAFNPFNVRMKLYRSRTPRAFSWSGAKQALKISPAILVPTILAMIYILL